jgi:hypothetical protein
MGDVVDAQGLKLYGLDREVCLFPIYFFHIVRFVVVSHEGDIMTDAIVNAFVLVVTNLLTHIYR